MNTTTAPQTVTTTWNIDPAHSTAEFKVKHMMITNVKGQFTNINGLIVLDPADISKSRVDATIEAASIHTRNADRHAHLRSADFFDVEKFPNLTFVSNQVTREGDEELKVDGDLAIHGVTR